MVALKDDSVPTSSFFELVQQLQCRIADASHQQKKAASVEASVAAPRKPSHEWTCVQLLSLLLQYPAGVTAAVMETELLSQWRSQVCCAEDAFPNQQLTTSQCSSRHWRCTSACCAQCVPTCFYRYVHMQSDFERCTDEPSSKLKLVNS